MTNLVFLSVCFGTNVNLNAYGSVWLNCFGLFVFTIERNPESVVECRRIAILIENPGMLFFWFQHVRLVVVFVYAQRSLGQNHIIESLREVELQRANHLVRGEEVSVVALNCEFPVLTVRHHSENQAVIKAGLTCLASVVGISLAGIFSRIEEASEVDIQDT
jgi:hypothetical protein